MIIRAILCALDWNNNVNRPQKVDELGKPMFREKVSTDKKNQKSLFLSLGGQVWQDKDSGTCIGCQGHQLASQDHGPHS